MSAADIAETPQVIKLADGFFIRQAVDNIAWIDLGDAAVVIDALEQHELKDEVFAAMAETLGERPVRHVLNTHTHYDHIALNEEFAIRFGAEVVNRQTCELPADGRWFRGPSRELLMRHMPGCHTDEDCIVWAPKERVLFTGDIFGWGLIPLTRGLTDETARTLLDTYSRMIALDASTVVPGHGPLCTNAELRRWMEYFRWLIAQASELCAKGEPDVAIVRKLAAPDDMREWWRFLKWKHRDSVDKVIRAVRRDKLTAEKL